MTQNRSPYASPKARVSDLRIEKALLLESTTDTADNQYNPENDLGGIE